MLAPPAATTERAHRLDALGGLKKQRRDERQRHGGHHRRPDPLDTSHNDQDDLVRGDPAGQR